MRSHVLPALFAPLALACTAPVESGEDRSAEAPSKPEVAVFAETTLADGGALSGRTTAVVTSRGHARDLGLAAKWLGTSPALPPPGTCARAASLRPERLREQVELLPVREVSMGGRPLVARAFPDVGGGLGGVVYTSPDARAPLGSVSVTLDGGEGSISIDVSSPAHADDATVVARDDGLHVTWSSPDASDLEFVEVVSRGEATLCVPTSNRQVVPGVADDAVVTIHRVRVSRGEQGGVRFSVHADALAEVRAGG